MEYLRSGITYWRKSVSLFCTLSLLVVLTPAQAQKKKPTSKQPNIIVILADDMGFSDVGSYGGEIQTPNIDLLAKGGLRFNQFYNASRCCPTRAALLTGLYNHQAGIGNMTTDQQVPGYRGYLTENTVTIAEVLKTAGYQTGMVGKWHVSNTQEKKPEAEHLKWQAHQVSYPEFSPLNQYPTARGFDKYYGNIWGVVNFFDPFGLVNGNTPVPFVPKGFYYTDALNDSAAAYVKQFHQKGKPFFLYVSHTAPHWPLHALPQDIAKYRKIYQAGWDSVRNERYRKMIKEGLFPADKNILSGRWDQERKWADNPDQAYDIEAMAVRAAMIDRMDQGIGRLIKTLKETGELDNTLILFLSDNGASSDNAQNYGPGYDRPGETRTGEKIQYPVKKEVLPGPENTFASHDKMWSNVANAPFRYWKTEAYEGGICTPLIAYWPKGLIAKKGSVTDQVGHVFDFMATFVELAGAQYPKEFKGHKISAMAGKSLVPVFQGKKREVHEYLFFEHIGRRAVRHGDWKIVTLNNKPWELYNLKEDRTEMNNLAAQHPEKVKQLAAKWQEWADQNQVFPKPTVASK
ncbi:arylsulfatase [Rufibacter radiotolerans]|uniref:Arylsulfatase n=1 Tax=Rufibacter radiotolerans TaxID=1379910 RepID=A0A0H4VQG6_9BACT|nr:arylsulfatase [Rufibacter radiotolerans]AKQ46182.1 arylsulfatase [Rufibacter radiotolerans]